VAAYRHRRQGAPAMPCRQVFGLADVDLAIRLLAPLPGRWRPVRLGFRLRLPLRGSSGLAPDSRASPRHDREWRPTGHNISGWPGSVNPIICG